MILSLKYSIRFKCYLEIRLLNIVVTFSLGALVPANLVHLLVRTLSTSQTDHDDILNLL